MNLRVLSHSSGNNIQRPFKIQKIQTFPMDSVLHHAIHHNPDGIGTSRGPTSEYSSPGLALMETALSKFKQYSIICTSGVPEEVIIHRACNSVFSFRNARSGTIDPHHTGNRTILASRLARATVKTFGE